MTELEERVARAIANAILAQLPVARAAIEAMREPTAVMLEAPEMRNWAWRTDEKVEPEEIAEAWRSMIDAALDVDGQSAEEKS